MNIRKQRITFIFGEVHATTKTMVENRPRYNSRTFHALIRNKPHVVVRDAEGVWWTRGALSDDVREAGTFRWEYMVPPGPDGSDLKPGFHSDLVWLPLDRDPDRPLPFLVLEHFRETHESSRQRRGPPRGEGMERAGGRVTAFSKVCGAVVLQYLPDRDVADRSDVAAFALRSARAVTRMKE